MAALAACALLAVSLGVWAQTREELREEFHRTYPLAASGRVSLENINGTVRIVAWDRNEVKVDAVKRAYTAERLAEAEIRIDANADSIRIKTKYPEDRTEWNDGDRRYRNPASVDYTLTVPRGAQLDRVQLINGPLEIEGVRGDVDAGSVNGRVTARGLVGRAHLSVVNGPLEATFDRFDEAKSVELSSVNGPVTLSVPSDANAEIRVSTLHGGISNDFGLPVRRGRFIGQEMAGRLGGGGTFVKLSSVNGPVNVRYARDGRTPNAVTNLLSETPVGDDDLNEKINSKLNKDLSEKLHKEISKELSKEISENVNRDVLKAQKETRKAAGREAARETARAARAAREAERATRSMEVNVADDVSVGDANRIEQESKSFAVAGTPRVRLETFDGHITVHSWGKPEVMFTASKRAHDEREMQGISLRAEQSGDEVTIISQFDKSFSREVRMEGKRVISFSSGASVSYDVYVPRNATLRALTGDGRLRIEGVNGEIDLQTGDGSIDVSGGRGRLRAQTGDGRIQITSFDGEADARTGDGRISLDGRFTQLAARTGDGSISLSLPTDVNATIETDAETVNSDGVAVPEDTDTPEDREKRVRRWKVGRGGQLITLRTGDGQIVLRQRQ